MLKRVLYNKLLIIEWNVLYLLSISFFFLMNCYKVHISFSYVQSLIKNSSFYFLNFFLFFFLNSQLVLGSRILYNNFIIHFFIICERRLLVLIFLEIFFLFLLICGEFVRNCKTAHLNMHSVEKKRKSFYKNLLLWTNIIIGQFKTITMSFHG